MPVRERERVREIVSEGSPLPSTRSRPAIVLRVRRAVSALVGVPLLVMAAMVAMTLANRRPAPTSGPRIELRAPASGSVTALVFGAGSGIHFMRLSDHPRTVHADLGRGPLRVLALRDVQLNASGIDDPNVIRVGAIGSVLQLRRDGAGTSIRAGF